MKVIIGGHEYTKTQKTEPNKKAQTKPRDKTNRKTPKVTTDKLEDFNIDYLVSHSSIPTEDILRIVENPEVEYNVFSLPKRKGGFRQIAAPSANLRKLQHITSDWIGKWAVDKMANNYVYGFKKNVGVSDAIRYLTGLRPFTSAYKIDLKDFFDQITSERITKALEDHGLSKAQANLIARIGTRNGTTPQGAPTSPALSNIAFYETDLAIGEIASTNEVKGWLRYADDIIIVTTDESDRVPNEIILTIESFGWTINKKKTGRRTGTGLKFLGASFIGKDVTPTRRLRRSLYALDHILTKYMAQAQTAEEKREVADHILTHGKYASILGQINWASQINPGKYTGLREVFKEMRRVFRTAN